MSISKPNNAQVKANTFIRNDSSLDRWCTSHCTAPLAATRLHRNCPIIDALWVPLSSETNKDAGCEPGWEGRGWAFSWIGYKDRPGRSQPRLTRSRQAPLLAGSWTLATSSICKHSPTKHKPVTDFNPLTLCPLPCRGSNRCSRLFQLRSWAAGEWNDNTNCVEIKCLITMTDTFCSV